MFIDYRLFYTKTGRLKYISHLDTNRLMQRTLKRSGLPVWYSEGFNPHIYITFALPLALGLESEYTDILGIKVPSLVIPVKPGRNLAVIIEVASMNNRQKKLGYNAAEDLLERLGMVNDLAAPSAPDHGPDQHDWEDY